MGRGANDGVVPSGVGVSQTDQPDVGSQNGVSGQELPIQGQLPAEQQTPQGEPFLGTKPEDIPAELQPMYKQWQANYTKTRQAETEQVRQVQSDAALYREKAEQLDTLTNNPDFQQWIVERNQQGRQQQGPKMPDMSFVEQYEDAPVIKGLIESIMQGVNGVVQPLQQELASIKFGMSRQQADGEFDSLVQQAEKNGWTSPAVLKRNMDFLGQRHPTLSLMDKYTIAERQYLSGGNIISKPLSVQLQNNPSPVPQEQTPRIPVTGDKGSPISPPGGTSAVSGSAGTSLDSLDLAIKERRENKGSPGRIDIKKHISDAIEGMRARGEKVDMRG